MSYSQDNIPWTSIIGPSKRSVSCYTKSRLRLIKRIKRDLRLERKNNLRSAMEYCKVYNCIISKVENREELILVRKFFIRYQEDTDTK